MFPKLVPSLVVLSALWGSHAAPSDDGVSYAVSRAGLLASQLVTGVILGSDSTGHTSYSIAFAEPFTINPTATAPDTTFSAAATLVEGSTDAYLFEVVTAGSEVVAFNDDCTLSDGFAACTLVGKDTAGAVIQSTAFTVTLIASGGTAATASATSKNGAGRLGVARASVLAVVVAGVTLVGAMV